MSAINEKHRLDFSDVVAASGTGTEAKQYVYDYISNGFEETALIYASDNLGIAYILGLGFNGADSDYELPHEYRVKDRAETTIYFSDEKEGLNFLKRAVVQEHAPVVHVDLYYLKDELSGQNKFWSSIPKEHNSHFMTVTGYDDEYIYLNDPTSHNSKNLMVDIPSFLKAWRATEDFDSFALGPYWQYI